MAHEDRECPEIRRRLRHGNPEALCGGVFDAISEGGRMSGSMKVVVCACATAAVLMLAGCAKDNSAAAASASGGPPPSPVRVAVAETRTVPVQVKVIGNVEAYKTISVKSQIGGVLTRVNFREGEPVRKGQLLFEIDPRPYQEMVRQIEANLARDTALMKQAEANLARDIAQEKYAREQAGRYEELARQGVFSRQQADQATSDADSRRETLAADRAAIESSKAAVAAGRAAIDNAKLQLSYCYIHSPVDGRTGNIAVKEGNLVKANDIEMVSVMQIQPVYVTFPVPERQLGAVRDRMNAGRLTVQATPQAPGAPTEEGVLTFIDNAVDQNTGTIKLKATFTNTASRLWAGQFVDVVLTLAQKSNVITIPFKAVQVGQGGSYVYVVKPDQTVEMRNVIPGENNAGRVEVQQGIAQGETVVTEGHIRLAPGARVKVQS